MEEARGHQGIPAFGEWNYGDGDDWPVLAQRFESAMHTQLPVHKACKRARACRRRRFPAFGDWNNLGDGDAGGWTTAVVNQYFEPVTAHKSLKRNSMVTTVASSPWGSSSTRWRGKPGWMTQGPTWQCNLSPSWRSRLLTTTCMMSHRTCSVPSHYGKVGHG
ncbi:uncharacterized protein LOC125524479 [Triticum urartu]|uniref:uncharacterized protein LOC125524479 n=1 Tax=Triticum urartu TaxID=4572 RepID=UPI002043DA54|nr:uncharacterized protein LOC125524479 [Triticum urartu]